MEGSQQPLQHNTEKNKIIKYIKEIFLSFFMQFDYINVNEKKYYQHHPLMALQPRLMS